MNPIRYKIENKLKIKLLHKTFLQVDLCSVDERDPIEGGSCRRHGPTLGHRGLRRHEESLHGELKRKKHLKLHHYNLLLKVEMYNPEEDSWSFVASMESHEGGVGVGVIPMV